MLLTDRPVAQVRPSTIDEAARTLRALEPGSLASNTTALPFGRLERASEERPPRLVVLGIALDAEALERLARAMRDWAEGTLPRTWAVYYARGGRLRHSTSEGRSRR